MNRTELAAFAKGLIDRAESQQRTMRTQDAKMHAAGEAFAFRLALSSLHIWSEGKFGESLDEQSGGDRKAGHR